MNESYVECLVARKPSGAMRALQVGLVTVAVIGVLLGMFFAPFLILAIAAGIGAYFVGQRVNLEFEYLYVDREITVDKILNKTRRKKAEKFEADRIEILAPINSWHMDNFKNREYKVTDYSRGIEDKPDRRYVMIYDGGRKVLLEPSEAFVRAVQSVAPRKVFLD